MSKKYIVRLSEEERTILHKVISNREGSRCRIRRAQILLQADVGGSNWNDKQIAKAFSCVELTVINIRKSFVRNGLELTLNGKQRGCFLLNKEQESKIISLCSGAPPKGCENWSLRLLATKVIEAGIVDSISHETIRKTLRKKHGKSNIQRI